MRSAERRDLIIATKVNNFYSFISRMRRVTVRKLTNFNRFEDFIIIPNYF